MYGHDQIRDSYQNLVCSPDGNESVESIGPGQDRDSVEHAAQDGSAEDADTQAGGSSSERHGDGHGRGASGDSYEDEADKVLLRPKPKASTTDTYDGGNLSPTGKLIE